MKYNFNVRVYGIWIQNGQVLINEELIRGKKIVKFPGGGLDWGEGTIDCLKREWKEELGLDIAIQEHFYTTDFFQASAYDNSQVISIYYLVSAPAEAIIQNKISNERTYWQSIDTINGDVFSLAIDKKVGYLLEQLVKKQ
jgi:8-oxo-dGTP diphosphatase